MIEGILGKKAAAPEQIVGSARTEASRRRAQEKWGIEVTADNGEVVRRSGILFLAVKPQSYEEVIAGLRGADFSGKTVVSLAPGKSLGWLEERLGGGCKLVRCMPNTPALVGEGITTVCFSRQIGEGDREAVLTLLRCFGGAEVLEESQMDAAAGIGGCAPAWTFMLLEAMADGAVAEGLPRECAYRIAAAAVRGSAAMLLETGKHPGQLKDMVCSPGGTTISAVRVLEEKGFRGAVMDAVIACVERSRQL